MSVPRPYRGFPYSSPVVHDAPSVDPAAAARWRHLPRTQVGLPVRRVNPRDHTSTTETAAGSAAVPRKAEPAEDPEPGPIVYIDLPAGGSSVSSPADDDDDDDDDNPSPSSKNGKRDPSDEPVVYIEMPEAGGSELTRPPDDRSREPEYVQETIFFNPFENRRIEEHKPSPDTESHGERTPPTRAQPTRPATLDLYGPGTSGGGPSPRGPPPGLLSKQTMVYGELDGFPMSPIPVSEFPEPPPSYADIDRVSSPMVDPQEPISEQPRREQSRREQPPRTQVILPTDADPASTPIGVPNSERKYLNCHHCGMRVHSLVVRENGRITHCFAITCLVTCMLPCVAFIYCSDALKIRNHYCPSCNKVIGYQNPFGHKIVYVN